MPNSEEFLRIFAIFEPKEQNLLDKLVGRSAFYDLAAFAWMAIPDERAVLPDSLKLEDLDGNGTKEIVIGLKSEWADGDSVGLMIFRKDETHVWNLIALPSISELTHENLRGKKPYPGAFTAFTLYKYFGVATEKQYDETPPWTTLSKTNAYEDHWTISFNSIFKSFVTLRNGGSYSLRKHPKRGYLQVSTIAFFDDGRSVMGPHYAVVTVFKLEGNLLVRDPLWNWGYPMISIVPLQPGEIHIDSIQDAGIEAHMSSGIFFGYTEFGK